MSTTKFLLLVALAVAASVTQLVTASAASASGHSAIIVAGGAERPDGKAAMFYDALAPHGDWFRHDRYGWVWRPHVGYGWRPYTEGFWVYTDLGWTWQCDLEWGWAPFHYGRWAYETNNGWVWVPDDVWGPAWVAWQMGDPWCGWAPLPPLVAWESGPAWDVVIPPFCWSFVEVQFLPLRTIHQHIVPVARNVTLLHETRNVTKFAFNSEKQIVNSGVDPARVERAIGHPLARLRVENVTTLPRNGRATIQANNVVMFRPDLVRTSRPLTPLNGAAEVRPQAAPPVSGVPTPTGPTLSREFLQRQEAERRALAEEQAAEAARLEEIHRRELAQPPHGMSLPNLAQRHLEEHHAFNEQVTRQNQLFEQRAQQGRAAHRR